MATKFTAGPWQINAGEVVVAGSRQVVATVKWGDCWHDDVDDANARLIAAAPELYEALNAIMQPNHTPDTYDSAYALARAALAKATQS